MARTFLSVYHVNKFLSDTTFQKADFKFKLLPLRFCKVLDASNFSFNWQSSKRIDLREIRCLILCEFLEIIFLYFKILYLPNDYTCMALIFQQKIFYDVLV